MPLRESRVDVKEVQLVAERFCIAQQIPREQLQVSARYDYNLEALRLQLDRTVWSRELDTLTLRFPADWWEALKERFAPRWFIRRCPVRRAVVDLTAYHAYPDLVYPRGGKTVLHVRTYESDDDA